MSAFEVYVLFQLDSIVSLFGAITIFSAIVTIIFIIIFVLNTINDDEETVKKIVPHITKSFTVFIAVLAVGSFIPSTKTAAAMYVIPAIVNNEKVQQLPDKLLDLVNERLDELMKKKNDPSK